MRRDPGLAVLAAALVVLLGLLYSHGERLTSDGVDHYVYLRSLAVDHDLDLANDYEIVSPRRTSVEPPTRLGRTGNVHPLGPAILWAPFYAVADLVTRLRGQPADGWNPLYRDAVAVGSLLYGWAGLGLALAVARGAELSRRHPLALPSLVVLAFVGFNLLVAAQYKSGVLSYSDPVSFEEMGRGAVSAVDRAVGSLFSLPGALLAWLPASWPPCTRPRPTSSEDAGDRLLRCAAGWS